MTNRKITLITGFLGLFGSVLVGFGEFFLHYSPQVLGHGENYEFFKFVSQDNLITGHFMAVVGVPFYFVGYYHIYKMLESGSRKWAVIVFCLGILSFTLGGFWIASRAFLGTIIHLQSDIDGAIYQQILDNYTLISESLVQGLRVVIFLLSVFFVIAILKGNTLYRKWMVFFNPFILLVVVISTLFIMPSVGKYLAPIAMNVVHFILFGLSLVNLKRTTSNRI